MDYAKALFDLCSVYTQTGHGGTRETLALCQSYLPDDTTTTLRPSASIGCGDDIFLQRRGQGSRDILLMGHYDTVPGDIAIRNPRQDGDKIFGLGTWDMKGGIVLALDLMNQVDEKDFAHLDLLLTGDEENPTGDFKPPGVYDLVLSFEGGTAEGLVASRFGAGVLEITIAGDSLRAEYPLPSPGGIDITFDIHNDLRLMNTPDVQFTTSNVKATSAINVVAPETEISGVLRYKNIEERDRYLAALPEKHHGFTLRASFREVMPPLFASSESIALCNALEVYAVTRIGSSSISWMYSHSRLLFDGLGPFGAGDHTPEEHVLLSSFARQARLGQRIIRTFANSP